MLNAVRIWILFSTLLVAAGWILSALHELNRAGYGVVLALAAIATVFWQRKTGWKPKKNLRQLFQKLKKRFKQPAPLLFLLLALLSFLGGVLYAPSNGDSNAYRIPRVLHWLAAQQWHWIHTFDSRMNIAACGFEWLSAPLILFAHTDRPVFLINAVSYCMLPGLIFSVFTRLQVRPRTAWWWMWILSSGWCFAMQAGSVVNDSFAAIYALAAVDFALRAKERDSATDLWISMFAAALLTAAKQTNIPLVLLWFIAAWPALSLLKRRFISSVAVTAIALLVSVLPTTFFNWHHSGNWMGFTANGFASSPAKISPFWGIIGNTFCILIQNLLPPFFPWAEKWDASMERFVATPFGQHFASFEHFGRLSFGKHGVNEGNAGIGLLICIFILISIFAAHRISKKIGGGIIADHRQRRWLRVIPWALLLIFMAKVGSYENARQLAPYYPFFFAIFLVKPAHTVLARCRWWQRTGLFLMLFTLALLVIARSRPLFPAQTILHCLHAAFPNSHLITRAEFSFNVRSSVVQKQREWVNDKLVGKQLLGYATTIGSAEPGLWFPWGQRRVIRVTPDDSTETLRARGIHFVVVDSLALNFSRETIEQWMEKFDGKLVGQIDFRTQPNLPTTYLYLVELENP